MALFLTILEGTNSADARPILASRVKQLRAAVAAELARRFDLPEAPVRITLVSLDCKLRLDAAKTAVQVEGNEPSARTESERSIK